MFGYGGYGMGGYGMGGYGGYGGYGYGNGYGYGGYGGYGSSYGYPLSANYNSSTYAPAPTPMPTNAATDYASLGEAAFRGGDYDGAIRNWQHALIDAPNNGTLVLMVGQALFAVGKYPEAAGAVQTAMQASPVEQWNAVVAHSNELYGSPQAYADQITKLEQAALKTDSPATQFLLGYHHGYRGDPNRAVADLEKGMKLEPQDQLMRRLRDVMQAKLGSSGTLPLIGPAA
jgi:tetratricopeptide (TPR) repeat protein